MAEYKPEVVSEIILKMPVTKNVTVLRELADAVLKMPPKVAARLGKRVKTWADVPKMDLVLVDKLGELVVHLAWGGQIQAALALAQVLLEVLPDPANETCSDDEIFTLQLPPEPKVKIDLWHYKRILEQLIPKFVKAAKKDALELFCRLLDKAITYSRIRGKEEGEDNSWIWREAIENPAEEYGEDLKNILVDSVRDAAELLVRDGFLLLPEVVEYLESQRWSVFRRIALYLLKRFPDKAPELISLKLRNPSLFGDRNLQHEFGSLLREQFTSLTSEQQELILSLIEDGTDFSRSSSASSLAEEERHKKIRQLRWLTWIKDELPEEWKQRYESLVTELGEPKKPISVTTWVGPQSPKSAAELRAMSVSEIVNFLKTWQPQKEILEPSPEGLGRELAGVVEEDPERFAKESTRFCGLDPTYVCSLLHGLEGALRKKKIFSWGLVLELCKWVTEQPREIPGRDVRSYSLMDVDPHWGWTRKQIAHLFRVGFDMDNIPFDLRKDVWLILMPITDDSEPTPEYEDRYGPPNMDWLTLSLNTTRGEAIHAVISYALWVHRISKIFLIASRGLLGALMRCLRCGK